MARNTEEFKTIVTLNAQQAQDKLKQLQDDVDELKKKKEALLSSKNYNAEDIRTLNKEIRHGESAINAYKSRVADTIDTLNHLDKASLGEIQSAVRNLKREIKTVTDEDEYRQIDDLIQKGQKRILELKSSAGEAAAETQRLADSEKNVTSALKDINGSSLENLKAASMAIQEKMNKLNPQSQEFENQAKNLLLVRNRIREVNAAQGNANTIIDQYDKELSSATKSAAALAREQEIIDRTLGNINGANIRDLEYSLKLVNERLRGIGHDDKSFDILSEKARKLKEEINKVNSELQAPENKKSIITRSADFLNKNWGAITQGWAALTGLTSTIRQCSNAYAEMEDVMADTRKYTGQTDEQVREMNEDFKKMNTRSSREELNALAGAAGRLGISSKEAIEDFVDAADKISVALGDDLGDGAVDQIGKLAMAFGEDKKMGLKGAMLSTGSAVNELAQSCSASAGYLVDFTARVAGVGKQFGLTQTQIMGFAAVMDENMQKDEMASTAFSQLLTKMTTDTKTFAKMSGIEVGKFSKMLKEDANGAVITFLETLNKKGNFTTLAKMFQDMGLDGTRATAVLTTMADKIDDIKKRQQTANDAYKEGTSVITEFDVQNETVQAGLDKAKKNFNELTITLGQKLMPIAKFGVSTASLSVYALNALINFTLKYWRTIVPLTAAIAAYTIAIKWNSIEWSKLKVVKAAHLVIDKAQNALMAIQAGLTVTVTTAYRYLTGQITATSAAQTILNKVILANPYVAAAAAVAGITAALIAFIDKSDEATESQKELTQANAQAATECRGEIAELSELVEIAKDKTASDAARQQAIKQLQDKYPDYLSNLSLENIYSEQTAESISNLTNQILAQAQARVYLAKVEEMEREKADVDEEYLNSFWGRMGHGLASQFESFANNVAHYAQKLWNAGSQFFKNGDGGFTLKGLKNGWNEKTFIERNGYGRNPNQVYYQNWRADWNEYDKKQKMYLEMYRKAEKKAAEANAKARELNKGGNDNSSLGTEDEYKTKAEQKAEEKARTAAEKAAANAAKKKEALKRKAEAQAKKDQKAAIDAQKALTDAELVENYRKYAQGEIDLRKWRAEEKRIRSESIDEQIKIFGKESNEAKELTRQKVELEEKYNSDVRKMDEDEIRNRHASMALDLQQAFEEKGTIMYQNQESINEALYENELDELSERQALYQKGSQEWLDLQSEIEQKEGEHKLQNAQHYQDLLSQMQEQYGKKDIQKQKTLTMNGIAWLEHYEELSLNKIYEEGEIKTEEYNKKKNEITEKYARLRKEILLSYELQQSEDNLNNSAGQKMKQHSQTAYTTASNNAKADFENDHPEGTGVMGFISSDVTIFSSTLANIKKMEEEGVISHEEAMAAMGQATTEMCQGIASKMQAAYDAVSPIMDAMSSYYSAQSDYEVSVTEKKYEKLIQKAGSNQAKQKKLEEKKQKELAKIKTKYAKKQAAMDIAQAIAQSAINALNAYGSVWASKLPLSVKTVLAPVMAGVALAAGAIQIATIKKQQQAQEAGYYEGGFTGGSNYRRKAGIVHEGEFVANHNTVNNPQILPALQIIDQAQRNNTIGSLTAADVSRSMGVGSAAIVSAPTVKVQTDNSELASTLQQARDTIERLGSLLDDGVSVQFPMESFKKAERHWDNIQKNK